MKLPLQLTRALSICLLCAIGFGVIAIGVSDRSIARFDDSIASFVQGLESPALTNLMKFFTFIGGGYPVVIVTAVVFVLLYYTLRHRNELVLFVWVVMGSALLNEALKLVFHRARPILHRIVEANGFSFPSGHSMAAFSLYGILAYLLWRHISTSFGRFALIVFSTAMILLIGISRIYLGVHYPSDVLGGFLASGSWLAAWIWYYNQYKNRREKE